jgi:hypothetical protein
MHHALPHAAILAAMLAITPAAGETRAPPVRPYAPVAVSLPAASDDTTFVTFRAALAATAKGRIYAELGRLVMTEFFWDRDFSGRYDPRRPAVDNLAAALRLEHRDGSGWDALAAFAAETALEPMHARPGVVCAPPQPRFDAVAFARLLDDSNTGHIDWAYPAADNTAVRMAPEPAAAPLGTLRLHFVRLLGFVGSDSEPAPGRSQWARIAMPDAGIGFVAPGSLRSPSAERLCYIKDLVTGWRIAGFVAGGL